MLKAIDERNYEAVQAHISNGTHINAFGGVFDESPLHKSAQLGWTDGIELLLSNGADAYSKNHYDQTPLHYACAAKSSECVRLLLDAGCEAILHQDKRGYTPLHDASARGSVKCVKLLLKAKAEVDARDINDETPLHKSAKANSIATMLLLLNEGADLGAKDKLGESPLCYILRHMPGGLDMLLDHCLYSNSAEISSKKLEIGFNFLPISGAPEKNQVKNLHDVVEFGHPELLLHPLCESYLLLKWTNVRRYFFFEVILYFFYAIITTILINDKFVSRVFEPVPEMNPSVATGFEVVVFLQTVFILLKEALMMYQDIRTWMYSVWHVSNVVISILVFSVLPGISYLCWQHFLTTILMLLLWVQCMLHMSRFPSCGIYIVMFSKVAKVFLRIFGIFFCLLLAFTMSFYISKYGRAGYCTFNDGGAKNTTVNIDALSVGIIPKTIEADNGTFNGDSHNVTGFGIEGILNSSRNNDTVVGNDAMPHLIIMKSIEVDNGTFNDSSDNGTALGIEGKTNSSSKNDMAVDNKIMPNGTILNTEPTFIKLNSSEVDEMYQNVVIAFFKVITMMIGELDFDSTLVNSMEILPGVSHIIFLAFVILVSVILSNLLVALAVNDVQALRNSAYLERLIKQMGLVFEIEKTFETVQYIGHQLNLRFAKRRKTIMHNFLGARVTLKPYHSQKGSKITVSHKDDTKEVEIKKCLVNRILDCLKAREGTNISGAKMSIKRIASRPSAGGPEEIKELLKSVESFMTDLSNRMEDMMTLCGDMNSRLRSVEESVSQTTGTVINHSYPRKNSTVLERNPLEVYQEDMLIAQHYSENEASV